MYSSGWPLIATGIFFLGASNLLIPIVYCLHNNEVGILGTMGFLPSAIRLLQLSVPKLSYITHLSIADSILLRSESLLISRNNSQISVKRNRSLRVNSTQHPRELICASRGDRQPSTSGQTIRENAEARRVVHRPSKVNWCH